MGRRQQPGRSSGGRGCRCRYLGVVGRRQRLQRAAGGRAGGCWRAGGGEAAVNGLLGVECGGVDVGGSGGVGDEVKEGVNRGAYEGVGDGAGEDVREGAVRAWWCRPPGAGSREGATAGCPAGRLGARAEEGRAGQGKSALHRAGGIPSSSSSLLDVWRGAGAVGGRAGAPAFFLEASRRARLGVGRAGARGRTGVGRGGRGRLSSSWMPGG